MIKRILTLGIILAILAAMVPAAVLADGSTGVTGTMDAGALDHFALSNPGPQTVGNAFDISIIAQDVDNNTVTGYAGQVNLTETGGGVGGSITPALSDTFSSGVLSDYSVTLTKPGTNVTITVTDHGGTKTGISATFTVNIGAVSASQSTVVASPTTVPDDNSTTSTITVTLNDAGGNPVSGKTVSLQGTGTSSISAPSGPSTSGGIVTFTVKDSTAETVTYTATGDSVGITETASVNFVVPTITLTAPSTLSLTLVNAPTEDTEIVGTATAGGVAVTNLGNFKYTTTVTGSVMYLTQGSEHLANPLMIATGDINNQLGNVSSAAGVTGTPKAYSPTDEGCFTVLTGSAQTIGANVNGASTLNLYVFQKINNGEAHKVGTYTLTLTYSVSSPF
ncbi:MAG: Ig-like domain-containing protein [Dehalococcoidales bacterium]